MFPVPFAEDFGIELFNLELELLDQRYELGFFFQPGFLLSPQVFDCSFQFGDAVSGCRVEAMFIVPEFGETVFDVGVGELGGHGKVFVLDVTYLW